MAIKFHFKMDYGNAIGNFCCEAWNAVKDLVNPNKIDSLLDGRPELIGSTREKLLAAVQNPELSKIVNELYRPGATVGDGERQPYWLKSLAKVHQHICLRRQRD